MDGLPGERVSGPGTETIPFHLCSMRNSFDRGRFEFGEWGKRGEGVSLRRSISNPSSSWRGVRRVTPIIQFSRFDSHSEIVAFKI